MQSKCEGYRVQRKDEVYEQWHCERPGGLCRCLFQALAYAKGPQFEGKQLTVVRSADAVEIATTGPRPLIRRPVVNIQA